VLSIAEDVSVDVGLFLFDQLSIEDCRGAHGDGLPLPGPLHVGLELLVFLAGDLVGVPLVRLDLV